MAPSFVALRRDRRRVVTAPEETPSAVLTHLALAITRYVRQLRMDELPVPPMIDELAAFLTLYVRTRQAATGVDGDYGTPHDVPVVRFSMEESTKRFTIHARHGRDSGWTLHATGRLVEASQLVGGAQIQIERAVDEIGGKVHRQWRKAGKIRRKRRATRVVRGKDAPIIHPPAFPQGGDEALVGQIEQVFGEHSRILPD